MAEVLSVGARVVKIAKANGGPDETCQ